MKKLLNSLFVGTLKQAGVTLVELMIYMGMFSILLLMLLQMFTSIIDVQLESNATSSVELDGRYLLTRFSRDIHNASAILVPSVLGAGGATLQISGNGFNYTYNLSGGNLTLTDNVSGTTDALNSIDTTVSSVTFTRFGDAHGKDAVQVKITLVSKITPKTGVETKTFQTTIGMR